MYILRSHSILIKDLYTVMLQTNDRRTIKEAMEDYKVHPQNPNRVFWNEFLFEVIDEVIGGHNTFKDFPHPDDLDDLLKSYGYNFPSMRNEDIICSWAYSYDISTNCINPNHHKMACYINEDEINLKNMQLLLKFLPFIK